MKCKSKIKTKHMTFFNSYKKQKQKNKKNVQNKISTVICVPFVNHKDRFILFLRIKIKLN